MFLLVIAALAPNGPIVQPKIVAASMFKNGYAVVTREIDIPPGGKAFVSDLPAGSLGTVWITTTEGLKLAAVKNEEVKVDKRAPAGTIDDLLRANVGKIVKLGISDATTFEGKLVSASADVILLQSGDDVVALKPPTVRSIQVVGGKSEAETTTTQRMLDFTVVGARAGRVYMIALERGLTWSPSYSMDISDPKKLKFVSKAVILDDDGALHDVEARLVTGFPNVFFLPVIDPLLASETVDDYIRSLGMADAARDARMNQLGMGGQMMMQNANLPTADTVMGDIANAMSHGNGGIEEGDLFFYKQPHVTLDKGDRAYYVLADADIDYREIYTWDSADAISNNRIYDYNPQPNQPAPPDDVWHSLTFKNTVGQPLTTGPAVTFKNGELMGQDMLKYTGVDREALVKVTKALDVHAESADEEVDRKRVAVNIPGAGPFDLVTLRTTLKATNSKTEAIHLKVTRPYTGELEDSGDAKVTKNVKGLRSINPTGTLVWERDVAPGKTVTLSFSVKVYVRSGG